MPHRASFVLLWLVLLTTACSRSHQTEWEAFCADPIDMEGNRLGPFHLRLLVVVDRGPAMAPWQSRLAEGLRETLHLLARGNPPEWEAHHHPSLPAFAPPDTLRLAAITADVPVDHDHGTACPLPADATSDIWHLTPQDDANGAIEDVVHVATAAADGCAAPQPLEAATRWLDAHPDFVTEGVGLHVLVLTASDDCSVADPGLLDPEDPRFEGDLPARCANPDDDAALQPVGDHVNRLAQHLPPQGAGVLGIVAGLPPDLWSTAGQPQVQPILDHPLLTPTLDEEGDAVPSCTVDEGEGDPALAWPPRRLVEAAAAMREASSGFFWESFGSLCLPDTDPRWLHEAWTPILPFPLPTHGRVCLPRPVPADDDGRIPCRILAVQPWDATTCDAGRGRLPVAPPDDRDPETGRLVCEIQQRLATEPDLDDAPGWYYVERSDAHGCASEIHYTRADPIRRSDGRHEFITRLECCP